jgi:hypothetical protein
VSEKVKVSHEVAEAIEELYIEYGGKTEDRIEVIVYDILKVLEMRKVFGGMRLQHVIKAITEGYEVEPQFKVEDWVAHINGGSFMGQSNVKVVEILSFDDDDGHATYGDGNYSIPTGYIRHATPEEIKAEKERQLWKSIGREVGELKEKDFVVYENRYFRLFNNMGCGLYGNHMDPMYASELYKKGYLSGFYPVESFISFESGEEE